VHLKSLTLKGFKSFAQPTTFAFEPGVTCVVGPNGSGKSNVVDALAWVMGEQGAKTLRGGSMEDVIFAGTTSKAPLGRAEVLLTIDNSDGALPIDYAEVTISRTLFRNGGSEYAINKEPCRLLDVQELLSDSGLGREMHVIVGQGQLDQVLHASPEDRRRFIEEAAGILKHRRRKEKTQRKLESMEANLTRLNDLAGEIRRQLTPLGRQAEIAREAQTIQAVVRDAQARVFADDVVSLGATLDNFQSSESERAAERATLADQLDGVRRRIQELESTALDSGLDSARSQDFAARAVLDRLKALESIARERSGTWDEGEVDASTATTVTSADIEAAEALGQEALELVASHEAAVGEVSAAVLTLKASLAAVDQEIASVVGELAEYDNALRERESALEVAQSRVLSSQAESERQRAALDQARARVVQAEEALRALHGSDTEAPDGATEAYERALGEAEERLALADATEANTRNLLHQQEREREALAAKVSALTLALRTDGADPDIAAAAGVTGSVADSLRVDAGYETAIARALGSLADAVLVNERQSALRLVEQRSGSNKGRVELVIATDEDTIGENIAGLSRATDVVRGPSGVLALLSKTYIAGDLAALTKVWATKGAIARGVTIVTLAGDVFTDGVVRTGSGESRSRLELQAERDTAESALTTLSTTLERTRFEAEQARAQKALCAEGVKTALADVRQADAKRAEFGQQLSRQRAALEAAEAEVARLVSAATEAEDQVRVASEALVLATEQRTSFQANPRPSVDESARSALLVSLDTATAQELQARIALEASRERARSAQDVLASVRQRLVDEEAAATRERARHHERRERAARATSVLALLPGVMAQAVVTTEESSAALLAAEAKRQSLQGELTQLRTQENTLRERLGSITDSVHSIEMQIYEKKLQRTTLLERVQEELGLTEETLLEDYAPHVLVPPDTEDGGEPQPFNRAEQEARLQVARRKRDQLGRVNPLALEEFQALETRHTFLTEQLVDLKKTRADLEAIMAELDDTMQTIFADAFADTQRAFDEVFPLLFPGGHGSLTLTHPDDLLLTGIEVSVRPAGKKIERLSLLSGGERSLAAVALLIAIFKARPSPFYILDEVEAALDDANLGRLLSVIESLRQDSQLIVITHQKRTMEIADALYGVSMRKDGVSAVVGQRIKDSEAVAS
jgi:chromosome segregation protein